MNRYAGDDRAQTILVLAKEPVPGRAKTRLQSMFSPEEAASLAASSIEDTLQAVRASRAPRKVLAWDGDPTPWDLEFEITPQPSGPLNDRLSAAFEAVLSTQRPTPVLLIGMDTPQVTSAHLDVEWDGADAVLGLSEDGGFWAIGLRPGDPRRVFDGIPMSTDRTGSAQLARLSSLGLSVRLLPPLRDVDLPADAEHVATTYPWLGFSRRHRELVDARQEQTAERLFDRAFTGAATVVCSHPGSDTDVDGQPSPATDTDVLHLDVARWSSAADGVDLMVVSRCEAPVVDLGCGPGRMVVALNQSGRSALGVDMSAAAVGVSMRRGGPALHRRITDRLPGEGRWGTALLVDTNIGMGGDVEALLRRCCQLVAAGGLIICEVDAQPERYDIHQVALSSGGMTSTPIPWARVGGATLARVATRLDLVVAEEWSAGGRMFVTLRKS